MNAATKNPGGGLVAIEGGLSGVAGAIVFWRLSGALDASKLRVAIAEARDIPPGFPVPRVCGPETATQRAISEHASKRMLVRPLPQRDGYALVEEAPIGKRLTWRVLLTAKVDPQGNLEIEEVADEARKLVTPIRDAQRRIRDEVATPEVSAWLSRVMTEIDGVRLRESGGIYFIPAVHVPTFHAIATILKDQVGGDHLLFEVPAMRSDEAVAAILDAVSVEATVLNERLNADLLSEKFGKRGLASRAAEAEAMEAKLARYEKLLGARLEAYRDTLTKTQAALTVASLKHAKAEE